MSSTYSPLLGIELMATGDQSGTWGDTTNTNLGTLLEQAVAGVLSVAEGDATLTLTATQGASNQARNAVVELTGAMTANRNVIVPTSAKLYVISNATTGGYSVVVKTVAGTGITVLNSQKRFVYCDGTNVVDALSLGTIATQAASNVAVTGGTVTGLTSLTLASGAATPATNDAAALGTSSLMWSDLFLASGGVINWNNGDVTITHSANTLAFAGASSGYTFDAAVGPASNDGAALGAAAVSWSDLFLASGAVVNFNNGNYTLTHSSGLLTASGAFSVGTSNAITAGTIELGAASDTTISRDSAGVIAVEGVPLYSNIPQNSQSTAYTTVLSDAQKHLLHPTADNNARTFTIAANASVAYPVGTAITFINEINTMTIAINSDTLVLAGSGSTGSRTLAAMGMATAIKKTTTSWIISGSGLT